MNHLILKQALVHKQNVSFINLIPYGIVEEQYFSDEKTALEELTNKAEQALQERDEYVEEHGVEEGLLWEAIDDEGKINQKLITDRLKEAKS